MSSKWQRALREPGSALAAVAALAKGYWYKRWLPLRGVRFSAGRNFRVSGKLRVRGPGEVTFGDDVHVAMTVTPYTYKPDARIVVGSRVFLNGTRFGCDRSITIGDRSILAECRIMDTNFHSLHANRHDANAPVKVAPVVVGRNVWVAVDVTLLPGTEIGEDSVVGVASVCRGEFPAGVVISGNPAQVVGRVPGSAVAEGVTK